MATTRRTAAAATVTTAAAAKPATRTTRKPAAAAQAAAAAADKAKARKPAAQAAAAPRYVVVIDGTTYTTPFALSDWAHPGDFARDVVAALVWAHTGKLPTSLKEIGGSKGRYVGHFHCGKAVVAFAFGAPELVSPTAPAAPAAPAEKPAKPAPAAAPVAAARKVASEAARGTAAALVVGPKLAGGMPVAEAATVATAAAAASVTRYSVTVKGHGTFTADRTGLQSPGGFASVTLAPRVAEITGAKRANVETVTPTDSGLRVRFGLGEGRTVVAECALAPAGAAPLPAHQPLPAFVTRGGQTVDALAAAAGHAPRLSPLEKALAKRDQLNATAAASVGTATPAGASKPATDRQRAQAIAAAGKLALKADQPRRTAVVQAMFDAAAQGVLPAEPDFSKETHARYRKPLAEIVAKVKAGDLVWLKAHPVQPLSSSRVILRRFIDLAIVALEARAAKPVVKASKGK